MAPIPIEAREGFATLLHRIEDNGVLVEDAARFACDLMVQEVGIALLDKRGVRPADALGRRSDR